MSAASRSFFCTQQLSVDYGVDRVDPTCIQLGLLLRLSCPAAIEQLPVNLVHPPGVAHRRMAVLSSHSGEGRSQAIVKRGRCVIDGELGERKAAVPIVLTTVGVGAQRVAIDSDAVGPLHLGFGVLVLS